MDYGMAGIIIPYLLLTVNEASPFSSTVISLDEWTGNPLSSIPFFLFPCKSMGEQRFKKMILHMLMRIS